MTAELPGEIVPSAVASPDDAALTPLARAALDAAMPPNTRRAYESAWREFAAWCAREGRCPLPATPATLAAYAAWACHERPARRTSGRVPAGTLGVSPASARQMLAAVRAAHRHSGYPAPDPANANQIVRGYEDRLARERDPRARPRRADPFTRDVLAALTGSGLDGAQEAVRLRDTAMLYLNYAGATRVSELAALDIGDVREDGTGYTVAVYRRKVRVHTPVLIARVHNPVTCAALDGWLRFLAAAGITEGPLFPRVDKHGRIGMAPRKGPGDGRMGQTGISRRIALAAAEAGLEGHWTAHSGRRGFVTVSTAAGSPLLAIAAHGGWDPNSRSMKMYADEAEMLKLNPLKGAGI